mgnify:CR=1 FL=1
MRLISTTRGAGFEDAGTILLGEGSFRRQKIDAVTALSIGEAIARLWIGGDTTVRGEGHGVVREGLTRFLATLFIEKQFGAEAAEAERARQRVAYSGVAKRDGPLSRTTPLDATYFNSVANKGAMVWRLVDHLVGRDAFCGDACEACWLTAKRTLTVSRWRARGGVGRTRRQLAEDGARSGNGSADGHGFDGRTAAAAGRRMDRRVAQPGLDGRGSERDGNHQCGPINHGAGNCAHT